MAGNEINVILNKCILFKKKGCSLTDFLIHAKNIEIYKVIDVKWVSRKERLDSQSRKEKILFFSKTLEGMTVHKTLVKKIFFSQKMTQQL